MFYYNYCIFVLNFRDFIKNQRYLSQIITESGDANFFKLAKVGIWSGLLNIYHNFIHWFNNETGIKTDDVGDLARVLRLPGTFNCKGGGRRKVKVLHYNKNLRYDAADIPQSASASIITIDASPFEYLHDSSIERTQDLPYLIENCKFITFCKNDPDAVSKSLWIAMGTNVHRCSEEAFHAG